MAEPTPVPLVVLLTMADDARHPRIRRHALEAILLIVTLAVVCGADNGTEVGLSATRKQA